MEIEVRQNDGTFAKAFVQAIEEDGITVAYPQQWKPNETLAYDQTRAVLTDKPLKKEFKNGDTFEAYYKKSGQPTELWQTVRMRDTKVDIKSNL